MVIYHGIFHVIDGQRPEYIRRIRESGLVEEFTRQRGNVFYTVAASVTNDNDLIVSDLWESRPDFEGHVSSQAVKDWHKIYHEFVESCEEREYEIE